MEHQQKQQLPNKTAFVLGNGTSRKRLVLKNLQKYAVVYACNAIYREYTPNYLVAVDVKMINEIVASGYNAKHPVWTNPNRGALLKENLNYFSPHKGWSSGPTALWFASQHHYKEIYIFGFDYQGLSGKFNNVYADTDNYKRSTDSATYYGNWLHQTVSVIKENPKIKFYRVIGQTDYIPDKFSGINNLSHIRYEEFGLKFPECI